MNQADIPTQQEIIEKQNRLYARVAKRTFALMNDLDLAQAYLTVNEGVSYCFRRCPQGSMQCIDNCTSKIANVSKIYQKVES